MGAPDCPSGFAADGERCVAEPAPSTSAIAVMPPVQIIAPRVLVPRVRVVFTTPADAPMQFVVTDARSRRYECMATCTLSLPPGETDVTGLHGGGHWQLQIPDHDALVSIRPEHRLAYVLATVMMTIGALGGGGSAVVAIVTGCENTYSGSNCTTFDLELGFAAAGAVLVTGSILILTLTHASGWAHVEEPRPGRVSRIHFRGAGLAPVAGGAAAAAVWSF